MQIQLDILPGKGRQVELLRVLYSGYTKLLFLPKLIVCGIRGSKLDRQATAYAALDQDARFQTNAVCHFVGQGYHVSNLMAPFLHRMAASYVYAEGRHECEDCRMVD